jgi:hypothetical protein
MSNRGSHAQREVPGWPGSLSAPLPMCLKLWLPLWPAADGARAVGAGRRLRSGPRHELLLLEAARGGVGDHCDRDRQHLQVHHHPGQHPDMGPALGCVTIWKCTMQPCAVFPRKQQVLLHVCGYQSEQHMLNTCEDATPCPLQMQRARQHWCCVCRWARCISRRQSGKPRS